MLCGKEWTQLNYGWWTVLELQIRAAGAAEEG